MSKSRLVTTEEAQRIARETKDDFRAAVEETRRLRTELDEVNRYQARKSPPPTGASALRALKLK